jgi:hypothetical protein
VIRRGLDERTLEMTSARETIIARGRQDPESPATPVIRRSLDERTLEMTSAQETLIA